MEIETPVSTYVVDYTCDDCGKGKMRPEPFVHTSMPPQYPHTCNICGNRKTFYKSYPYTIWRGYDGTSV